jgi:hypothetical protein
MERKLTIQNVLTSIAILAVLSSVLIPLAEKLVPSSDIQIAMFNAQRVGKATLQYAEVWEGVLPRLDNNGSCIYGESPCATPDWGNLTPPGSGAEAYDAAGQAMFFGAIRGYLNDDSGPIYDSAIGPTNWFHVFQNQAAYGITAPAQLDPQYVENLGWVQTQMAVNLYMIDSNQFSHFNNRAFSPRGRLNWMYNHQEKVLFTMESAWNWNEAVFNGLGNTAVWGSNSVDAGCKNSSNDGWTFYILEGRRGNGQPFYGHPDRALLNPNLQGKAVFLFADSHAAPMTYPQAEACVPTPTNWQWVLGPNDVRSGLYYPHFTPEIE